MVYAGTDYVVSSERECMKKSKKNSRIDRPQNQRREQQQRVQQPKGAAAREQPQQGKGTITRAAAVQKQQQKTRNDDVGEQQKGIESTWKFATARRAIPQNQRKEQFE